MKIFKFRFIFGFFYFINYKFHNLYIFFINQVMYFIFYELIIDKDS